MDEFPIHAYFSLLNIIGVETRMDISILAFHLNSSPELYFCQTESITFEKNKGKQIHDFYTYKSQLPNRDHVFLFGNESVPKILAEKQPNMHLFGERKRMQPIMLIEQYAQVTQWLIVPSLYLDEVIKPLAHLKDQQLISYREYDYTDISHVEYLVVC